MANQTKLPVKAGPAAQEETGISLARPRVWPSRIFPGAKIAVSVRDIQLLCSGGKDLSVERATQFLLYCAGYGVDPRIQQAYLVPFRLRDEEGKPVLDRQGREVIQWQSGLHYTMFMQFASSQGVVLGHKFDPDPLTWPAKFDPEFRATVMVFRRKPLLPVRYSARLGAVAQMTRGQPGRAWSEGKVGWEHMFRVALLRRGYREAMSIGPAYGAEEFGEEESPVAEGAEEAEFVPSAPMVLGAVKEAEEAAEEAMAPPSAVHTEETAPYDAPGQPGAPETAVVEESQAEEPGAPAATAEGVDTASGRTPPCPTCGRPTQVKEGSRGRFLFCTGFEGGKCRWSGEMPKAGAKPKVAAPPEEAVPVRMGPVGLTEGMKSLVELLLVKAGALEIALMLPAFETMPRTEAADWIAATKKRLDGKEGALFAAAGGEK